MTKIHLGRNLLDHQLLDDAGRRCGNVDDLAIEGGPGERAFVVAVLSGPGYLPQRAGWVGRLTTLVAGKSRVRIPWNEIAHVDSAVNLKGSATSYGLGRGDDRLRPLFERIPGADR